MATTPAASRKTRRQDLVRATRALFDERGMQDAPVEEIARSVGIARGLIYREFSSKEELYVMTVTDYLEELRGALSASDDPDAPPPDRLARCAEAFADFSSRYPAFLDSSLALMRRPAHELNEAISDAVWLQLGQGMAACLDVLAAILRSGNETGEFEVEDPDYLANLLWAQMLGAMHLVRIRVGVRQEAPGVPGLFPLDPGEVRRSCVDGALALARGGAGTGG